MQRAPFNLPRHFGTKKTQSVVAVETLSVRQKFNKGVHQRVEYDAVVNPGVGVGVGVLRDRTH
jgi:hypothetical protein